jgi:hypothetical protein
MIMEKLPILLITYKRLDTTKKVFASIKEYKPERLYLFSDGAKSISKDQEKVALVRDFLKSNIDWDCEVQEFFSKTNLGCKYGPQQAISWLFNHEEKGIILEDDTVPAKSFYPYCEELLIKYQNDLRVWNIGGTKMDIIPNLDKNSYRFSKFPHTWGWATWADRWNKHIELLPTLIEDGNYSNLNHLFPNSIIVANWKQKASISFLDKLDAWDYLWSYRILISGGLSTTPNKNLISNIGFGEDATHTNSKNVNIIGTEEITLPLTHPKSQLPSIERDVLFFENYFNWKPWLQKLKVRHILAVLKSRLKG